MEDAGVGGLVAQIEREHLAVFDLAGEVVDTSLQELVGTLLEPERFGHAVDEDGFGWGGGLMFVGEFRFECVESGLLFHGEEAEGAVVTGQTVDGSVL